MNTDTNIISEVIAAEKQDEELHTAVVKWYEAKVKMAQVKASLEMWEKGMLFELLTNIVDDVKDCTAKRLLSALRVNAIGDVCALAAVDSLKRKGVQADATGYVEDNEVTAGVWMSGKTRDEVKARADEVRGFLAVKGYDAEVQIGDDEGECEAYVYGTMPFDTYLEKFGNEED